MSYDKQVISELTGRIKEAGFRVFLAERETYGFFTDEKGTKVVSFQVDYLSPRFSGNYITDKPASTGTGWQITDHDRGDYSNIFSEYPPRWALGDAKYRYATLEDHLKRYQSSSKYQEV